MVVVASHEPLIVLGGVSEVGICQSGSLFDELEGLSLGRCDFIRVAMLGTMG